MCEPITLSTGAMWALGASAAATVAGTALQYKASRDAQKYNDQVAANNARLAEQEAQTAQALGDRESQQQTWRTRAIIGQQRAAMAARGLDETMGTPLDILGETAMFGEMEQQNIRLNAARSAWGYQAQSANILNQNTLDRYTSRQQRAGTILSGISNLSGSAMKLYGG